jgi:hypothetical protein
MLLGVLVVIVVMSASGERKTSHIVVKRRRREGMNRRLWQPHVPFIMMVSRRPRALVHRSVAWIRKVHDERWTPWHCL